MKSMAEYNGTVKQYAKRIAKAKVFGNAGWERKRSVKSLMELFGVDLWWAEHDLDRWTKRYQRAMGIEA